ncbi:hypothetical protein GCM10023194_33120 [Planotetraspora phitsanulokensis]|uniref:KAP NTPase domain-containing protein n=1 Tax=Planotetraspora phitsanulokensis TaxID=575192 RepID=A0A8J3XCZ9_9ACTN|nr:hypothetical protein [Planotetraspora phitsanulokensis]GII36560.1 hypothetical protein Pph01_15630 [Planotetraspora phitsanulokensis]
MDTGHPMYDDAILCDEYMAAINEALRHPEIRDAFDNVWVTPFRVRVEMVRDMAAVLAATPQEYADYRASLDQIVSRLRDPADAVRDRLAESHLHLEWERRALVGGAIGLVTTGAGLLSGIWSGLGPLTWVGSVLTLASGLVFLLARLLRSSKALHRVEVAIGLVLSLAVNIALHRRALSPWRNMLLAALKEHELAAQIRLRINALRHDRFTHAFTVHASPGLSEAFDSTYHVPTSVARELDELLGRLSGASIGVAGPRGAGKSTLIRRFCEDPQDAGDRGDLRCLVSAPVEYAPRDFVLHLFATFCRRTLDYLRLPDRSDARRRARVGRVIAHVSRAIVYCGLAAVVYLRPGFFLDVLDGFEAFFSELIGRARVTAVAEAIGNSGLSAEWIAAAVLAVGAVHTLVAVRRLRLRHRESTRPEAELARRARRHLAQIRYLQTHTSGWSGTLKLPVGLDAQHTRGRSRAEQPLSYPETVAAFRAYAHDVAEFLRPRRRLFIGIDELDKIGSGQEAERFLNDIKGIFGLSRVYFMISVSDDAMNAFERRGLPFRDAFDSSFDEVIQVGPLAYEESLRVLYRRVVGLTEPYVAFCHCLSGGLPRDLIRAARRVVRAGRAMPDTALLTSICGVIIREELQHKAQAIMASAAAHPVAPGLLDLLHGVARDANAETSATEILKTSLVEASDGPALDFVAYAYFCATLEEVFTEELTAERIRETAEFDTLAAARRAFAVDTGLAWRAISSVRREWHLDTWELPTG